MVNRRRSLKCGLVLFLSLPAFAADSMLAVDRGLPQINLNNSSGPVRSNVRWTWHDQGFLGDSFAIGAPGEQWVIDSIRTWTVPGNADQQPNQLGDFYQDVRLYFGKSQGDLTPVQAASLSLGSNATSNPSVQITEPRQSGSVLYDDFGTNLRVWQVDFSNLNLVVDGGTAYSFGVWGNGRQIAGTTGKTYSWFNHASNGPLSGASQDSADGVMSLFDAGGRYQGTFTADGSGWDKSADINVQVFAHPVHSRIVSSRNNQ
jgi:hypothetical protein